MTSTARQPSDQPAASEPAVLFLRVGNPYYRGLCDTYHELKRTLRTIQHRSDPISLAKARRLDRARSLLLEAIVET